MLEHKIKENASLKTFSAVRWPCGLLVPISTSCSEILLKYTFLLVCWVLWGSVFLFQVQIRPTAKKPQAVPRWKGGKKNPRIKILQRRRRNLRQKWSHLFHPAQTQLTPCAWNAENSWQTLSEAMEVIFFFFFQGCHRSGKSVKKQLVRKSRGKREVCKIFYFDLNILKTVLWLWSRRRVDKQRDGYS